MDKKIGPSDYISNCSNTIKCQHGSTTSYLQQTTIATLFNLTVDLENWEIRKLPEIWRNNPKIREKMWDFSIQKNVVCSFKSNMPLD